jgi:uncharacterized protein YjeT (DUF2065 family)
MAVSGALNASAGQTRALGLVLLVAGLIVIASGVALYMKARRRLP